MITDDRHMMNVMIPMRDGIKLSTDIYLPSGTGCWPVIIERTPYGKNKYSRSESTSDGAKISRTEMARSFTDRGYVLVIQDCRGRYESEGTFIKYTGEGEDGFDTLSWLASQPWCNGKIGSMGLSYAAHTQLAMACLKPPALCAMVLDSGGFSNAWECGIRQGGAFEMKQVTWAYRQAKESPRAKGDQRIRDALDNENITDWFRRFPWFPGHSPLRHVPEYESYLLEQWNNCDFDEYWKRNGIWAQGCYDDLPDIPVLFMSSWYDNYVSSTLNNFRAFGKGSHRHRLIMGPWLHGDRNQSFSGDVDFGEQACFDGNIETTWLECRLKWFDKTIRHSENDKIIPDVSVFCMGGGTGKKNHQGRLDHGGKWLHSDKWPLQGTTQKTFWLDAGGKLASEKPAAQNCINYLSDPRNPVPTIGGSLTSGLPVFRGGAFDQREYPEFFGTRGDGLPLSARADVLAFQTAVLEQDLLVAGEIAVTLWVSSDAPDTDFTAKLIDVYPPNEDYPQGYAMNITDGIIRCRYRNGGEPAGDITGDRQIELVITPFATCNLFRAGHRLRLDIASSNFPHFDCNPNTGVKPCDGRVTRIARNTVWFGNHTPSHLSLLVLEAT
ncbi:CocE/NonD family hydrolase [Serratia sp. PF2-63]|uniref:CocE/NonD family hydrolase n=1 Tax=unclassified Serratia (in: enterobacteria) TaxID=2647522 RepID=UPI0024B5ED74|nr:MULTISPECIES: CocE/NonD family hydrolase [unclassified Serratia (in: enterobacteria)]MDI9265903.1 CocE/NonD family hydrolase [Serratia sp. PF2-63]MDI9267129.1 CocE/NonD family hydrolase [Serratia sp. PF-27]